MYKNIDKKTKLNLKDLVAYQEGQVVSKTLVQNEVVSMTIFSFDKGEEISTHAAGGDAMVTVLEGKGRFTVADEVFYLVIRFFMPISSINHRFETTPQQISSATHTVRTMLTSTFL